MKVLSSAFLFLSLVVLPLRSFAEEVKILVKHTHEISLTNSNDGTVVSIGGSVSGVRDATSVTFHNLEFAFGSSRAMSANTLTAVRECITSIRALMAMKCTGRSCRGKAKGQLLITLPQAEVFQNNDLEESTEGDTVSRVDGSNIACKLTIW